MLPSVRKNKNVLGIRPILKLAVRHYKTVNILEYGN
jgi:hypothetical protein